MIGKRQTWCSSLRNGRRIQGNTDLSASPQPLEKMMEQVLKDSVALGSKEGN